MLWFFKSFSWNACLPVLILSIKCIKTDMQDQAHYIIVKMMVSNATSHLGHIHATSTSSSSPMHSTLWQRSDYIENSRLLGLCYSLCRGSALLPSKKLHFDWKDLEKGKIKMLFMQIYTGKSNICWVMETTGIYIFHVDLIHSLGQIFKLCRTWKLCAESTYMYIFVRNWVFKRYFWLLFIS